MTERQWNRQVRKELLRQLPPPPPHGRIDWCRAAVLLAAAIVLLAFWAVVALAVASAARAQDLTVVNRAHIPAGQLRQAERMVASSTGSLDRYWGSGRARFVAHGGWPIYLRASGKSMDPAGGPGAAIGYHFVDRHNNPFAVVWTGATAMYGYPWQGTLDHEVKEILVDPQTTRLMGGTSPDVGYLAEVCDPVEDWFYAGNMQDFVTPAWFTGAVGPWDGMRRLRAALKFSSNGVEDYWDGVEWEEYPMFHVNEARRRHAAPPPPSVQAFLP